MLNLHLNGRPLPGRAGQNKSVKNLNGPGRAKCQICRPLPTLDISIQCYLGVVVLYYSEIEKSVKTRFLGIVELEGQNSDRILVSFRN